ncbi:MAG: nuclear transport factor 2 family protein [Solirubrobacteraceae bacterium]
MGATQRVLLAVLGIGGLAGAPLACVDSAPERKSAGGPAAALRTAKAYVSAYNARDGEGVCRLLDPAIRLPAVRSADEGAKDCAGFLSREIGSQRFSNEEYGDWRGARILRVGAVVVRGERASVRLRLRHRLVGNLTPGPLTEPDVLHLVVRDGRWVLAKPARILYRTLGVADIDIPATVLDSPGDPGSLDKPAAQAAPRFACTGRALRVADPPGDTVTRDDLRPVRAPAFDIRAVTVRQARTGTVCATIELARRVRPDTLVSFYWKTPGTVVGGVRSVRIDGRGDAHDLDQVDRGARAAERAGSRSGARGSSVVLQIPRRDGLGPLPDRPFAFAVSVLSLQREELWLADPLDAQDTLPTDASGNGGATVRFPSGRSR